MNDCLPALRPLYTTAKPNENILLYDGLLEISFEINEHPIKIEGTGQLEYLWFPSPHIQFIFSSQDEDISHVSSAHWNDLPSSLTLSDIGVSVDISITSSSIGGSNGNSVSGRPKEAITKGQDQDLAYVLFHVVNFHNFRGGPRSILESSSKKRMMNRIVLEAEEWKITLDELENTNDNVKSLGTQGGFAITHVGKLEKLDGQTFSGEEAREFLKKFTDFLSFARGFRVPVVLLVGYDAKGKKIWEYWEESLGNSWKYVPSWFPEQKGNKLAELFPGFLTWWQNWEESARLALYWYLEANYTKINEQSIILVQVALELIAWVLIVEKDKTLSKTQFKKLPASDNLINLFSKFSIPLEIPFSSNLLTDLRQIASESNWIDAPHAFTKIRNGIVHPETRKRNKIHNAPSLTKLGTAFLGLWYLELVLLAMFKYQGCYANRLENQNLEVVPWSQNEHS